VGRFGLRGGFARDEPANRDDHPRGTFSSMQLFSRVACRPPHGYWSCWTACRRSPIWRSPPRSSSVSCAAARPRETLFVGYAALSTGFAGMVMSVVLILTFQVQYGDVYQ